MVFVTSITGQISQNLSLMKNWSLALGCFHEAFVANESVRADSSTFARNCRIRAAIVCINVIGGQDGGVDLIPKFRNCCSAYSPV